MSGVREILAASLLVMLTWSGMPGSKSILSTVQERLPSYIKLRLQNRHKRHMILSKVLNSYNLHAWQFIWQWLLLPPGPFFTCLFPFLLLQILFVLILLIPLLSFVLFLFQFFLPLLFSLLPTSSSCFSSSCFQRFIKVSKINLPSKYLA